jgi:hypothetical protein
MAYAILAGLSPAFGLYTSFTGLLLYWLFGTSKDVVIGVRMESSTYGEPRTDIERLLVGDRGGFPTCWTSDRVYQRAQTQCLSS